MADAILADVDSSGIYQIRNLVNGKRYVGSAVNFARRWRQHRCELGKKRHNPKLQNAWAKYGQSSFVFEIIEVVADCERLIEREQYFIDSIAPEYNVSPIAGSNYGVRWSPEVKERMSAASKSVWERDGHRQKMVDAHKGQGVTEEQKRKISEANTGRKLSPEHVAIVARNNCARNKSEKHRKLLSDFWKGRAKTREQIEKMAATKRGKPAHNRGKPMSEEQKAKQSAKMRAKYEDPAFRERISRATAEAMSRPEVAEKLRKSADSRRGVAQTEETKRRRSESLRATWAKKKEASQ